VPLEGRGQILERIIGRKIFSGGKELKIVPRRTLVRVLDISVKV
jgi:hypothetical protein